MATPVESMVTPGTTGVVRKPLNDQLTARGSIAMGAAAAIPVAVNSTGEPLAAVTDAGVTSIRSSVRLGGTEQAVRTARGRIARCRVSAAPEPGIRLIVVLPRTILRPPPDGRTGQEAPCARGPSGIVLSMTITVELPDDIATHPQAAREALEAFAIEGYRSGALTAYQTRTILGFSTRYEFDGFLKAHGVFERAYDDQSLEQDLRSLGRMDRSGLLKA